MEDLEPRQVLTWHVVKMLQKPTGSAVFVGYQTACDRPLLAGAREVTLKCITKNPVHCMLKERCISLYMSSRPVAGM